MIKNRAACRQLPLLCMLLFCGIMIGCGVRNAPTYSNLHQIVKNGDIREAKRLMGQGANINAIDYLGNTPLHWAARNGDLEMLNLLIRKGADINIKNPTNGNTALIGASQYGHAAVVDVLLQRDAEIDAIDYAGDSALVWACRKEHLDVLTALLKYGANLNPSSGGNPILTAASFGRTDIVRVLANHGADLHSKDAKGHTALILSCKFGHLSTSALLLAQGAGINSVDNSGATAIIWASKTGRLDHLDLLLKNGATINAQDSGGTTPLMYAAENGYVKMVRFLIEHGANVNIKSLNEWTALMMAASQGHTQIAEILLANGAGLDIVDRTKEDQYVTATSFQVAADYWGRQGKRSQAIGSYEIAAEQYNRAAQGFSTEADRQKFKQAISAFVPYFAEALLQATADIQASYQAKQTKKLMALKQSANSRSAGGTAYFKAFRRYNHRLTPSTGVYAARYGSGAATRTITVTPDDVVVLLTSISNECRQAAIRCRQMATCYKNYSKEKGLNECLQKSSSKN